MHLYRSTRKDSPFSRHFLRAMVHLPVITDQDLALTVRRVGGTVGGRGREIQPQISQQVRRLRLPNLDSPLCLPQWQELRRRDIPNRTGPRGWFMPRAFVTVPPWAWVPQCAQRTVARWTRTRLAADDRTSLSPPAHSEDHG